MIEIKLNKRRILASSSNTNEVYSSIVLFTIYYALKGKSKSVNLEYISFAFDNIINKTKNLDYDYVQLWNVNTLIKPIILLLYSYELLDIDYKNRNMAVKITDNGNAYVEEMINEELFNDINISAREITKKLTIKKLQNNKLLW
ncbi:TPA: hypothetical protein N2X84_004901 [Klebsiella pneumoniae]|nr:MULTISPECIES: hypothetical protein [Klebsiella]HBY0304734.1 hypothetical protein [Klebsiella pneumoniae subsp. pneumoniae]HCA9769022.1 hypothetical protein [Klebsiella variicola subsp. variicola]AXT68070.1 hypothetical protein CN260_23590 [Klebsiella pneumoniae]EKY0717355.1 hypothetical protein [Klebsiella pneumoniae]ELA2189539.1 hypothetical protein [Klebsiella pneumoniae]